MVSGPVCSFRSLPASDLLLLSLALHASFRMQLRNLLRLSQAASWVPIASGYVSSHHSPLQAPP